MPNSIDTYMKKRLVIANISLLTIFLTSCKVNYSKPITQESAKNIISNTSDSINARDYSEYSNIHLTSELEEKRITSFIIKETFYKAKYEFVYQKDPYLLAISANYEKKVKKEKKYEDFSLKITKSSDAYYVSMNEETAENINDEKYQKLWQFCDFPAYVKTISKKLISKSFDLIDSVGSKTDGKMNKLSGFQTSSKGNDDLKIDYTGREFGIGEAFFEENYNAETATEFGVYMSNGLINSFSSEYTFTVNEEDDYYTVGTFEGEIIHNLTYNY